MKEHTENLMKIAKAILDINPSACLTGTLMLQHRGVSLGRPPHDIDILTTQYGLEVILPEEFAFVEVGSASDGSGIKYEVEGVIVDILSADGETTEIIDGVRCGTLRGLIDAKSRYCTQDNDDAIKHYEDLLKIGNAVEEIDDENFIW